MNIIIFNSHTPFSPVLWGSHVVAEPDDDNLDDDDDVLINQ